jgi:hypothetical protein
LDEAPPPDEGNSTTSDTPFPDGTHELLTVGSAPNAEGGYTYTHDQIVHPNGDYHDTLTSSDGSYSVSDASGYKLTWYEYHAPEQYSMSYDQEGNPDRSYTITQTFTSDTGSGYTYVDAVTADGDQSYSYSASDGSYSHDYVSSNGSHGDSYFVAGDHSESNSYETRSDGWSESKSTISTGAVTEVSDDIEEVDGSYSRNWSSSDGSYKLSSLEVSTGAKLDDVFDAATGARQFHQTLSDGSVENIVAQRDTTGALITTDNLQSLDGSYSKSLTSSDGSYSKETFNASANETIGNSYDSSEGYGLSYDYKYHGSDLYESHQTQSYSDGSQMSYDDWYNQDGSQEHKSKSVAADGSSFMTDDLEQADGSSHVSSSSSDGSYSHDNFDASRNERSGDTYNAVDGSGSSFDNTLNADGSYTKHSWNSSGDGSTVTVDELGSSAGSFTRTTTQGDGSIQVDTFDATSNEISGHGVDVASGISSSYDYYFAADGSRDCVSSYTTSDGVTYSQNDRDAADGGYSNAWSSTDGSYGNNSLDAAANEYKGDGHDVASGSSYLFDNKYNDDGSYELKGTFDNGDGVSWTYDSLVSSDGSFVDTWSSSDGSHGVNSFDAASGAQSGDAFAGGSYLNDTYFPVGGNSSLYGHPPIVGGV